MKGVEIIKLECNAHERGSEFIFPNKESEDITVLKRKKGSVSGRHHHEGKNPHKDPEIIILVEGEMDFYFKNNETGEELQQVISSPSRIVIQPFIYHKVTALTDIIFLEFGSVNEGPKDMVKSSSKN